MKMLRKRLFFAVLIIFLFSLSAGAAETDERLSYAAYASLHANASEQVPAIEARPGESGTMLEGREAWLVNENEEITLDFVCEQEGLYQLQLVYYPVEGKGLNIEWGIYLDGMVPFSEAQYLTLYRIWTDETAPGSRQDAVGNDMIPGQVERPEWITTYAEDHTGTTAQPYQFYLTEGNHTLTLVSRRESFAIAGVAFQARETLPSYEAVAQFYAEQGYEGANAEMILEAEQTYRKSDTVLYARTDRSSPLTTPYSTLQTKLNTIGGESWSSQGQWIEWKFAVEEEGLYRLAFRARQDVLSGSFTTRRIYLDGEIPFDEFSAMQVSYDMNWQIIELPYAVYLAQGEHVLRMEATIGDLSEIVSLIDETVYQLNTAYRKIVMMTGTTPDTYRDYQLDVNIPEIFEIFEEQAQVLDWCDAMLLEKTGKRGSMNGILQTLSQQLKDFCEKPETVQRRLSTYKDNVGALGSWLVQIRQLPLELDKIYIRGAALEALDGADASFMAQMKHEIDLFVSSFIIDYDVIGALETGSEKRNIEVWVSAGRDQANIIKQLIENFFTPETNITVNLKLVQGQLMNATAAGSGPDVVLQLGNSEPVNYAVRKAAYDLTQFADFEEVAERFRESALTPYQLEGGVYALPETQTFSVMFYRTDVLGELGLTAPETWEDMFYVVGRLQRKNMTVGIQPPNSAAGSYTALSTMAMLLFQRGGEMYLDGNTRSGLGSAEAKEAFAMWVSLYNDYELPVKYDALTRFRSGEMPIVIEDFTFYNFLQVAAPEIRGLWSFVRVPGTVREDGSVDHSVSGTGIGCMLLNTAEDKDAAWEFMKWWTSAEIQTEYGKNIENQLGVSARYPSANVEAFASMPWSAAELATLNAEWDRVRGIPEVPGGYFTARHLNNAFRRVLNAHENAGETLLDYVKNIDEEIAIKRKEFGLEVDGQ